MIILIPVSAFLFVGGVFVYSVYKPGMSTKLIEKDRKSVEDCLDCLVTNIKTRRS
jgi:hypothetical protein